MSDPNLLADLLEFADHFPEWVPTIQVNSITLSIIQAAYSRIEAHGCCVGAVGFHPSDWAPIQHRLKDLLSLRHDDPEFYASLDETSVLGYTDIPNLWGADVLVNPCVKHGFIWICGRHPRTNQLLFLPKTVLRLQVTG